MSDLEEKVMPQSGKCILCNAEAESGYSQELYYGGTPHGNGG